MTTGTDTTTATPAAVASTSSATPAATPAPEFKPTQFALPVVKADGTEFKNAEELDNKIGGNLMGNYLLGENNFWHGGIHLTGHMFPHHRAKLPIRCIADGEVVAYRINEDYFKQTLPAVDGLREAELYTSLDFCLVRHDYKSPKRKDPPKAAETPAAAPQAANVAAGQRYRVATSKDPLTMRKSLEAASFNAATNKVKVARDSEMTIVDGTSQRAPNGLDYYQVSTDGQTLYAPITLITPVRYVVKSTANGRADPAGADFKKVGSQTLVELLSVDTVSAVQGGTSHQYFHCKIITPMSCDLAVHEGDELYIVDSCLRPEPLPAAIVAAEPEPATPAPMEETPPEYNSLRLYSLYMHLTPFSEYKKNEEEPSEQLLLIKVTGRTNLRKKDTTKEGWLIKDGHFENGEVLSKQSGSASSFQYDSGSTNTFYKVKKTVRKQDGSYEEAGEEIYVYSGKVEAFTQEKKAQIKPIYWTEQREALTKGQRGTREEDKTTSAGLIKTGTKVRYQVASRTKAAQGDTFDMIRCTILVDGAYTDMPNAISKGKTVWLEIQSTALADSLEDLGLGIPEHCNSGAESTVYVPPTPIPVKAGDPVGYIGRYDVQATNGQGSQATQYDWVHLELFSDSDEQAINDLLNNKAKVNVGRQYLKIPATQEPITLYKAVEDANHKKVMQPTEQQVIFNDTFGGGYLPEYVEVSGSPTKDAQGKEWYPFKEDTFIEASRGKVINQFDLKEMGFQIIKETDESTSGFYSQDATEVTQDSREFFKKIFAAADNQATLSDGSSNTGKGDGKLSKEELYAAFSNTNFRDVVNKVVAYHPSEWGQDHLAAINELIDDWHNKNLSKHVRNTIDFEAERVKELSVINTPFDNLLWHIQPLAGINALANGSCCDRNLNADIMLAIAKNKISRDFAEELANNFNLSMGMDSRFNSCICKAYMFSQMSTESGFFTKTLENDGKGKRKYDPFRGRGYIQLTGKRNYKSYENFSKQNFTENNNWEKLETLPHSVNCSVWFLHNCHPFLNHAQADDFLACCMDINGGLNGRQHRLNEYKRLLEIFNVKNCPHASLRTAYDDFEKSQIFNMQRGAFGWGVWHDHYFIDHPNNYVVNIDKNKVESIKGYERFLDLIEGTNFNDKTNEKDDNGNYVDKIWFTARRPKEFAVRRLGFLRGE
ncbi:hypothetical protein ACKC9G_12905 [Pokkaliibacter sp. CJK22405]|uniref:hypothetical protein n=1 Tax=Pokkaliibacter sp. CJK22405 TaxID=3384615 RepID=UPI003984EF9C